MQQTALTPNEILPLLADAPERLQSLTARLNPAQLQTSPGSAEWSANQVLAHLRACADVWGGYIQRILTQDRPAFRAVSPRSYIRKTDYLRQEFQPSLQAYCQQRVGLLAILRALPPSGWARAASVTMVGRVMDRTVLDYAERLVRHEQEHLRQVERTASAVSKP